MLGSIGVYENQNARCRALYHAVLRCALDDLGALLSDAPMPDDDRDHPMTLDQRKELFGETVHFFLNPKPSICSLDDICDALEIRAERIRSRVREVLDLGGEIGTPARRLLAQNEIEQILSCLDAGESSTRLAARYGMNPASIRKVRIRARRRAGLRVIQGRRRRGAPKVRGGRTPLLGAVENPVVRPKSDGFESSTKGA